MKNKKLNEMRNIAMNIIIAIGISILVIIGTETILDSFHPKKDITMLKIPDYEHEYSYVCEGENTVSSEYVTEFENLTAGKSYTVKCDIYRQDPEFGRIYTGTIYHGFTPESENGSIETDIPHEKGCEIIVNFGRKVKRWGSGDMARHE